MSITHKAIIKIILGFIIAMLFYIALSDQDVDELVPPTLGLKGLLLLGAPLLMIAWGWIEIIFQCSISQASLKWQHLPITKQLIYGISVVLIAIFIAFFFFPYIVYR